MGNYAGTACYSQDHACFSSEDAGGVETVTTSDKLTPFERSWQPIQPQGVLPDQLVTSLRDGGSDKPAEKATGVGSIVSAMLGFCEDATIQTRSCRSLLSIAQQPYHQQKVVAAGSIEAITGAMKLHPGDEELQHLACSVLGYLASLQEGQSRLLAADGANCIIASMGNHPESLGIQRAGCQALVNVPQILEDPRITSADAVVNVALAAMRLHPSDSCLQESACGILWCASLHEVGRSQVVKRGGVEIAVLAMRAFPGSFGIQRLACGLLLHIATCPNFQKALVDSGGLSAVVSAVRLHPTDVRILRRACGVLGALGASRQFVDVLDEVGAISAILVTLPKHRTQFSVQESACEALRILVQGRASALEEREVRAVLVEMVLVLVELREVRLREVAMRVIYFLISDRNLEAVESAGTVEAVVSAMREHAGDPSIQDVGQAILDALLKAQTAVGNPHAEFRIYAPRDNAIAEVRTFSEESMRTPSLAECQDSCEESSRRCPLDGDAHDAQNSPRSDHREYTFLPPKKSPPKVCPATADPFSSQPCFGESDGTSFACLRRDLPEEFKNLTNDDDQTGIAPHIAAASSDESVALSDTLRERMSGHDLLESTTHISNDAPKEHVEEAVEHSSGQDLSDLETHPMNDAPKEHLE